MPPTPANTKFSSTGNLPTGWRYTKLREVCTSFDYGTSAKSQKTGRIPVIRMGNIQEGKIDWSDLVYTSDESEIKKYFLAPQTVLFNRTNSPDLVGKTAIYRGERPAIFAGYLIRINTDSQLNPEFLNLCLNTTFAKEFCSREKTKGVSQSNINAKTLGTFEIPLPPLPEQRKIASILSTWDAAIEQTRKLLEANRQLKAGLMQKLLTGQWRFPKFGKPAANGELPEGWRHEKLGNYVTIISGNSPSIYSPIKRGKYPFVKVDDMNYSTILQNFARSYSNTSINVVPPHSIIFAKRGAAIETNKVRITDVSLVMDSNMMALVPQDDQLFYQYLYYVIVFQNLWKIADTSTIPQINNKHILPLVFPLPPLPEQRKIAEILSTVDKYIMLLQKSLEKLQLQKKGLMQKLLTGKIRVCF